PDPAEQNRVVTKLDALLARVEAANELHVGTAGIPDLLYPAEVEAAFLEKSACERSVGELVDVISDVVHPGDDPRPARAFVGLQHVESHTGRKLGQVEVGGEEGRKFRFQPGDILYGYLRPYLNKVWRADIDGLCSVDQY